MEKTDRKPFHKMAPRGQMSTCPVCDYPDGFHVSFDLDNNGSGTILLICPQCSNRFRIGWPVQLQDMQTLNKGG